MFSVSKLLWISFILLIFVGSCVAKPDPNPNPSPDALARPDPRGGGSRVHRNHKYFRVHKKENRRRSKIKKRRRYNPYGSSVIRRPVRRSPVSFPLPDRRFPSLSLGPLSV
ncbi:hypothetical protein Anas_08162 [Armadillidium nasatum]|uniref:Uncharacterized protein n=1 Tax=Armadillidium nasatum TaxID=96803 RepID=A0A5N5SYI7_9CRUS|nr:hypothetical protein Anas_08162 [Armadillidium nasatum]